MHFEVMVKSVNQSMCLEMKVSDVSEIEMCDKIDISEQGFSIIWLLTSNNRCTSEHCSQICQGVADLWLMKACCYHITLEENAVIKDWCLYAHLGIFHEGYSLENSFLQF